MFISGRSLCIEELARLCEFGNLGTMRRYVEELEKEYKERDAGIEIYCWNERYEMRVRPDLEQTVMHFAESDMPPAMLKTLALIAYKQPITQSDVVKSRGNRAYYYIKKLHLMEFIKAEKQGRTKILGTTPRFREYFRVDDLKLIKK